MLSIDRRGGAILLTDGVCVARISKSLHKGGAHFRRERSCGGAPSAERSVDDRFRGRRQNALGQWVRLSEQRPRPVGEREPYQVCLRKAMQQENRWPTSSWYLPAAARYFPISSVVLFRSQSEKEQQMKWEMLHRVKSVLTRVAPADR